MLKFVACSFAFLLGCSGALFAAPLQLYTEEYPPVSFSREGRAVGMATEVVEEILRRQGQVASIQVVPWARGYQTVQRTPDTALFATIRNAEREASFQWVGPILLARDSFYALKNSGLVIGNQTELAAAGQIAVPRDWFTFQELTAQGQPNLLGVNEPVQMFKMLRRGRIKLILADNLSFFSRGDAASQVDYLTADDVEVVLPYRTSYGYIAFWRGTDAQTLQRWQTTLDEMKADGSFAVIYQRWLPGEPQPPLREPR